MDENNKDLTTEKEIKEEIREEVKAEISDVKKIEFSLESLNLSKTSVINILEDLRVIKKRFNHIENILKESERSQHRPSRDLPGVTGTFDGEHMVTSEGVKMEVPKNYAAKSLLVFGDELKRMEQDGKEAFKILTKVPRKKIEGLLSKKDGKYVILSDAGSFNLSKNAVEFRNIKQGEWVLAVIPEKGPHGNFAAIDKVIKKEKKNDVKFFEPKKDERRHFEPKKSSEKPVEQSKPKEEKTPTSQTKPDFSDEDLV